MPQLLLSLVRFTQPDAHLTWPAGQVHMPIVHVPPAPHEFPQVPQLFGSVRRLVSQPLAAFPSQFPKPGLHVAMMHAPLKQADVACAKLQKVPQVPQLWMSVWVFTHMLPHALKPIGQVQCPIWHICPPIVLHTVPQLPQFCGSTWVSTHIPAQLARGAQLCVQVPFTQD
jgi:hypothetical protein